MRSSHLFLTVLIASCAATDLDNPSPGLSDPSVSSRTSPGVTGITTLTRNMYVGADVDAVIAALVSPDPNDDIPALLQAIQTLGATDFPTRSRAMAEEIARARPHAVGLQEVSTIDIDLSALGLPVVIHQDFLTTLLADLAARGLDYTVAAQVTNVQAAPLPGVSLVDRDVLLIDRRRVEIRGTPLARNYSQNIGTVAPGVSLVRGFVAVNAVIAGRPVTIASTHLESGSAPGLDLLRAAQAAELALVLAPREHALIMGDLNDVPGSPMHQALSAAGFVDAWATLHPNGAGLTCCHLADLSDSAATFTTRLDYVLARGFSLQGEKDGSIVLIGDQPSDRIPGPAYPIWPSDHAGLVARLR
ncbi:MAG: endonuclease/exonuclease/phosphatase family protein [Gemmatimonadales bacterium]